MILRCLTRGLFCRENILLKKRTPLIGSIKNSYLVSKHFCHRSDDESLIMDEEDGDREEYLTLRSRYFQLKDASHQVILVQPFIKNKTSPDGSNAVNNCELALAESKALVETLNWKVVDAVTAGLASYQKRELFGSGKLAELENLVSRDLRITAVFVSLYQLTTTQRIGLEDRFKVPVIDRYNIVLQIFHQHARTAEARLQVALAEIPYLKNRLMVDYERDQIAKHTKGNLGESVFDRKRFVLKKLEKKIHGKIAKIKSQRQKLRDGKPRSRLPTVAVVGYTNSGKTTLIKALTGDALEPADRLFATLDVTAHKGVLPSNLQCLFLDTVGFISDIPISLIASFSATLEDALEADLILHVRDVSHPDTVNQNSQVLKTLRKLNVSLYDSHVITTGNKIDGIPTENIKDLFHENIVPISALHGIGLPQLALTLDSILMRVTQREKSVYRVRTGSVEEEWLRRHAVVVSGEVDHTDLNYTQLTVLLSQEEKGKFFNQYVKA